MDDLRALIALASRRLALGRIVAASTIAVMSSMLVILLWVALSKGVPAMAMPWWVAVSIVGLAIVVAVIVALMKPGRDEVSIAVAVDQRLGLKERFATAVQVAKRDDPFAVAAVADAAGAAHAKGMSRRVREAFRPEPPRGWWLTPLIALALVFAWIFIPQGDFFARKNTETAEAVNARNDSAEQLDQLIEAIEENPDLAEEMADILASMRSEQDDFGTDTEPTSPEDVRREAIRKASEMQERLEEMLGGERAAMENALRENLEDLKAPQDGDPDAAKLAESLKKGDFSAAKKALDKLAQKMQEGELDPEKQKQLKEQLEDLAKQLQDLANKQKALEEELKKAGLDPQLANNPEALKQAIQNSQNLNEQQKKQLQQQAQAQEAACKACQGMGPGLPGDGPGNATRPTGSTGPTGSAGNG